MKKFLAGLALLISVPLAYGAASRVLEGTAIKVGPSGGTLTLPNATDTLTGKNTADVLTNKSISGASNTLTAIPNSATTAASANTPSAIVTRDGSGDFSAGTITAGLNGVAAFASNLAIDPSDCGAGTKATGIDAGGNLTCSSVNLSSDTAATALPATKGGTGQTTATTGDTLYASAANTLSKLAIGTDGSNYRIANGIPAWSAPTGFSGGNNTIFNNSYEGATTGWSASGGTFARTTTNGQFIPPGVAGAHWDSNGAAQTLDSAAVTINANDGLAGRNGVASCAFRAAAGTATHTLTAFDGTNNLVTPATITSSTTLWNRTSVNFIYPASGSVKLRLSSVAADEPDLFIDDCYMGLAEGFNLQNMAQASFVGSAAIPTTALCRPTRSNSVLGALPDTDCPGPTVEFNPGPGVIQTTDADAPVFTVNSLPPGYYMVVGTFGGTVTTSGSSRFVWSDGTTQSGLIGGSDSPTTTTPTTMVGYFNYTSTGNRSFQIFGSNSAGNAVTIIADVSPINFAIYRFPTSTDLAYKPEQINWKVDANINGGTFDLGAAAQSSYLDMTSATMTLTNNTSSGNNVLTAQIACSTTNPPTGTTCAAGNESNGVSFVLPIAGDVEACVDFGWAGDVGGAATVGSVNTAFEIVETPTTAQTISQEGKGRPDGLVKAVNPAGGARISTGGPIHICGTFNFASAGQKVLRLFYEQAVSGTVNGSTVSADAASTVGQRDVHWTVRPLSYNMPYPVLVGGVKGTQTNDSAATGYVGEYVEATQTTLANFPATGNYGDLGSITLTPGDWDINYTLVGDRNGASWTVVDMGIGTVAGNDSTGATVLGITRGLWALAAAGTGQDDVTITLPRYRVSLSATTTYYAKVRATYTVAAARYGGAISARRVR